MVKTSKRIIVLFFVVLFINYVSGGTWDGNNYFDTVTTDKIPWSGWWWPIAEKDLQGNDRINLYDDNGPLEKYDKAFSQTSADEKISAKVWEYNSHWSSAIEIGIDSQGHCNAWTAASILENEPRYGIEYNGVVFNVGDLKGLLTESYFRHELNKWGNEYKENDPTKDLNDIYPKDLLNQILPQFNIDGEKIALAIEREPGGEVWNYPVYKYVLNYNKSAGTGNVVFTFVTDKDFYPARIFNEQTDTFERKYSFKDIDYDEIIIDDKVEPIFIGRNGGKGQWEITLQSDGTFATNPDFAWRPTKRLSYEDLDPLTARWRLPNPNIDYGNGTQLINLPLLVNKVSVFQGGILKYEATWETTKNVEIANGIKNDIFKLKVTKNELCNNGNLSLGINFNKSIDTADTNYKIELRSEASSEWFKVTENIKWETTNVANDKWTGSFIIPFNGDINIRITAKEKTDDKTRKSLELVTTDKTFENGDTLHKFKIETVPPYVKAVTIVERDNINKILYNSEWSEKTDLKTRELKDKTTGGVQDKTIAHYISINTPIKVTIEFSKPIDEIKEFGKATDGTNEFGISVIPMVSMTSMIGQVQPWEINYDSVGRLAFGGRLNAARTIWTGEVDWKKDYSQNGLAYSQFQLVGISGRQNLIITAQGENSKMLDSNPGTISEYKTKGWKNYETRTTYYGDSERLNHYDYWTQLSYYSYYNIFDEYGFLKWAPENYDKYTKMANNDITADFHYTENTPGAPAIKKTMNFRQDYLHIDSNHEICIINVPGGGGPGGYNADETNAVVSSGSGTGTIIANSKIKVLANGFLQESLDYFTKLNIPVGIIPVNANYAELINTKVLVIPVGGLTGLAELPQVQEILKRYVENGGSIYCESQTREEDYNVLPTPEGENLKAAGYQNDPSCFVRSAYLNNYSPVLAGIDTTMLDVGIDGFIYQYPEQSQIILNRTKNYEPAYILYSLGGSGKIAITNQYTSWASFHGQGSEQDRKIFRDSINWLSAPNLLYDTIIPKGNETQTLPIGPIQITNTSQDTTKNTKLWVCDPDRNILKEMTWEEEIPPGGTTAKSITIDINAQSKLGIWGVGWEITKNKANVETQNFASV